MSHAIEKYAKVFENLELSLSKIASVEWAVSDAMILDELTDPLLSIAGGLANHATCRIGLGEVFSEPKSSIRSIVATDVISCANTTYAKLIPVRNRAAVGLIKRFRTEVTAQLQRLDKYTNAVMPRVRTAAMYGPSAASLSGARIIDDEQMQVLLSNAIRTSKHQKVTEMISWTLSNVLGNIASIAKDQALAEYIAANVGRFNQGDGFAPAKFPMNHPNPQLKYVSDAFFGRCIIGYFKEGVSDYKHGITEDPIVLEYPNLQDIVTTLESMSTNISRMLEDVRTSQLYPDEYVDEGLCDAIVDQSLDVRMYNTYYGDSSTVPEDVEVMINRIASIRLGQFSYLYYTLDNILQALPILMNYFIRDKIN